MKYVIFITIMLFSATQIISRTSVDKREDFMFSEKVKKVEVTEMHAFPHAGNIMSLYIFDQEGNMLRHCYYSDNIPRIEIHFYENGLNTESFYSFNTRYYIKEYNENGSLHKTMAYDFPDLDIDRLGAIYYGKKIKNFDQFKKKYLTDDN
ncbi:MAG: hypothetical protein JXR90_11530, partial [Spirochaetes bacterium]|nr:hypothetical protein [Spirochaetota bacterium]